MFKCRGLNTNVTLWLTNGIYVFPPESAEGKTYLYNILKDAMMWDSSILPVTFSTYRMGFDLLNSLATTHYNVVMLDRFDLYQNVDVCKRLGELSYNSIILLDVKDELLKCGGVVVGCTIELSIDGIEVFPA